MNNKLLVSDGITDNVGECRINKESINVSSFYKRIVAVNSCSGEVVVDTTYYDFSIYFPFAVPLIIVIMLVAVFWVVRRLD